jgi:hypothetical protein
MKRALMVLRISTFATATAFALAGCSEIDQRDKTQKVYAGKKDQKPYEGGKFDSDKTKWEGAVKQRNLAQNEYLRTETAK